MESIDGKEEDDDFSRRMEEKQPTTTQISAKINPDFQKQKVKHEKAATSSGQGQRQRTNHKAIFPGVQNPKDSTRFQEKCVSDG
ncbi:hypothetical protein O181_028202 [Austropuccinia psidii MF-1]|uniref:Uncharacterized protein n=1 Tax=Austropuccinia psidii MF-1 TaxID=1389203 RepID=A0A9Q3H2D3_9BASI|nr:hypothetical protein [Austropuccinia psidii MF-1]